MRSLANKRVAKVETKPIVQIKFLDHAVVSRDFADDLDNDIEGWVWGLLEDEDEQYYYVVMDFISNFENADYFKVLKSAVLEVKEIGQFSVDIS